MNINHNWPQVCTQLIGEMSDDMMWMGLIMFGLGLCLGGIWHGKGTEWEKNNQKEQKTNI